MSPSPSSHRPRRFRRVLIALVALLLIVGFLAFFVLPPTLASTLNSVQGKRPYQVSAEANELHQSLLVADMHADSLLWNRDLSKLGSWGAVDLPRLIEGNVGLQIFGLVTKTPRGQNFESNDDKSDNIIALSFLQRWPPSTWNSPRARALYQVNKLKKVEQDSHGQLRLIRSASELARLLEVRKSNPGQVGALLSVEGAHALEGELAVVDEFFAAGIRMMSPSHFFDTELGGSAHGVHKGGLSDFGRQVIQRMEELGMVVDLSHASSATFDDVLAMATKPVVVSHTGVRGTCDNGRNLSDAQLRAVAKNEGVVGIAFFTQAVCGIGTEYIVDAILHAVKVMGPRHVALGSDYDGAVKVPFDIGGMALITEALLEKGMAPHDIALIMGENVVRVLMASLPRE